MSARRPRQRGETGRPAAPEMSARRTRQRGEPGRPTAPELTAEPAASTSERILVALAAAAVGVVAFRGALGYGFSQDDFLSLARVRGLVPRLEGPWRILAIRWFWEAGVRLFGQEARPFHVVVLAAHGVTAALLGWLLSRRFPAPAAFLGAVLWAVHPASRTPLYWVTANGEVFMTLFLLLATAAYFARGPARAASPVLFMVALAWKESALLFPFALAALARLGPPPRRGLRQVARDPVLWALLAVSATWAAGISSFVRQLDATSSAYEVGVGAVARNLLTYASWTPTWMGWVQRDAADAVRPVFITTGAAVMVLATAALAWRPWRERGAPGAMLAAAALIAPVLPLANHTYHYYLYSPLAALAIASAAMFAAATRSLAGRTRWMAAVAIAAPLALAAMVLVHTLEMAPFLQPGSRSDGVLDRALIAANAIADVRSAALPAHSRLWLWSPLLREMAKRAGGDAARETYDESNVRGALLGGLALRVAVPALDSAVFVSAFTPGDSLAYWAVYRADGHLRVSSAPELARVLRRLGP